MRSISTFAIALTLAGVPACTLANQPSSQQKEDEVVFAKAEKTDETRLQPRVYLSADRLQAGQTQRFAIVIDIAPGWHINTNIPRPSYVIPTSVKVKSPHQVEIGKIAFPEGKTLQIAGAEEPLLVYGGRVIFFGDLKVPEKIAGQSEELEFALKYQLCNDRQCLAPKTVKLKGKVPVVEANAPVRKVNSELFEKDPRREEKSRP